MTPPTRFDGIVLNQIDIAFGKYWLSLFSLHHLEDPSLLPCPRTLAQAIADRGRFTIDEFSLLEPDDDDTMELYCGSYHSAAVRCFRTIIPR